MPHDLRRLLCAGCMLAAMSINGARGEEPPAQHEMPAAGQRAARVAQILKEMRAPLEGLTQRISRPDPTPTTRDLANAGLAKLLLGDDPREAEKMVELAFSQQEMDEKSPDFGMVPWTLNRHEIHDLNALEFATESIGPMLLRFGDAISPAFKERLRPHVHAALAAMGRRKLGVSYTNIFLMRATNTILLGEALGDAKAADEGYAQVDQWIDYTRANGIHEFDSPTYYAIDLDDAALGYRFARRPEGKAKFKAVLDYFWTDISANYFPATHGMCGPNSRNYSFLGNDALMDHYLFAEGLKPDLLNDRPDFEKIHLVAADIDGKGYHPDQRILALAALPQRVVRQRWDTNPAKDRCNYIAPEFSIGAANGDYGAQDKLFTAELASKRRLPVIALVPDRFDAPYGMVKSLDRTGHNKPTHPKLGPTFVQEKGALLALLDLDPAKEAEDSAAFATNLLLPADATEVWLDAKPVAIAGAFEQAGQVGSTVAVRSESAALVARVFRADACAGQKAAVMLKADADGLKLGVVRLAIYHYRGAAAKLKEQNVRVGFLILAAPCRSTADLAALVKRVNDAHIDDATDGPAWNVSASLDGGLTLASKHDLKRHTTLSRTVNGEEVSSPVFSVNGKDLAAEIWK